ncbi:MAG: TPM domain-containing protein, partial [Desulfofustis sp.]
MASPQSLRRAGLLKSSYIQAKRIAVPSPGRNILTPLFFFLLTLLSAFPAAALDVPNLQGRVNDYADMLSASTEASLESVLQSLETSDSTQIVVLTIDSLRGDNLEDFSLRVVENWKIGRQDLDNGVLLLVVRGDRKIRIEVGYGLEGKLTDLTAGRIIRNVISPKFRQGDFNQGIIDGVGAIVAVVRGEFAAPADSKLRSADQPDPGGFLTTMIFIFFFFGSMLRRNKFASAAVGGVATPLLGFLL